MDKSYCLVRAWYVCDMILICPAQILNAGAEWRRISLHVVESRLPTWAYHLSVHLHSRPINRVDELLEAFAVPAHFKDWWPHNQHRFLMTACKTRQDLVPEYHLVPGRRKSRTSFMFIIHRPQSAIKFFLDGIWWTFYVFSSLDRFWLLLFSNVPYKLEMGFQREGYAFAWGGNSSTWYYCANLVLCANVWPLTLVTFLLHDITPHILCFAARLLKHGREIWIRSLWLSVEPQKECGLLLDSTCWCR